MFDAPNRLFRFLAVLVVTSTTFLIAPAQPVFSNDATVSSLLTTFKRKMPPPRGSRGEPCAIAPGQLEKTYVIWSDHPLFLWQADSREVALQNIIMYEKSTKRIIWEKTLAPTDQSVLYDGNALQPGQTYGWRLEYKLWNSKNSSWEPKLLNNKHFQVMEVNQRRVDIATDLKTSIEQLKTSNRTTKAIAIQQAQYFVEHDLLSDALQVLAPVKEDPEIRALLQEITRSACVKQTNKAMPI